MKHKHINMKYLVVFWIRTSPYTCSMSDVSSLSVWTVNDCVMGRLPACLITNGKLYWTMIKCISAQESIMSNSLSRPSWDHFCRPSWPPRPTWTPWDVWPQWLSPSIRMSPVEWFGFVRRQTPSSEAERSSRGAGEGRPHRIWQLPPLWFIRQTHNWPLLFTLQ